MKHLNEYILESTDGLYKWYNIEDGIIIDKGNGSTIFIDSKDFSKNGMNRKYKYYINTKTNILYKKTDDVNNADLKDDEEGLYYKKFAKYDKVKNVRKNNIFKKFIDNIRDWVKKHWFITGLIILALIYFRKVIADAVIYEAMIKYVNNYIYIGGLVIGAIYYKEILTVGSLSISAAQLVWYTITNNEKALDNVIKKIKNEDDEQQNEAVDLINNALPDKVSESQDDDELELYINGSKFSDNVKNLISKIKLIPRLKSFISKNKQYINNVDNVYSKICGKLLEQDDYNDALKNNDYKKMCGIALNYLQQLKKNKINYK